MFNILSFLLLPAVIRALPTTSSYEDVLDKRAVCSGNTATTRSQWCNYNLQTNYYNTYPNTGVVRSYTFNIQNITLSPDGVPRMVQAINGQIPGPAIHANWGDTIQVTVNNQVQSNGSSLHFHGIRQLNTNNMDGVASITQCPVVPGGSMTYTWQATQYGSSWYHSHFAFQAWDGVFGPIIIDGPASANYDVDVGSVFVQDWSHGTVDELFNQAQLAQRPPQMDNGLINGMNVYGKVGQRWSTTFTSGKTYRLRFVNSATDSFFAVSIDNHVMSVISVDFVPINPYNATTINLGIGQRYDVLVKANQASAGSAFWLRAVPDSFCSNSGNPDGIRGVIRYSTSTSTADPTTSAWPSLSVANNCFGELDSNIVPALSLSVAPSLDVQIKDMEFTPNSQGLQRWYLDGSTFYQPWGQPTALQILNGQTTWNASQNVQRADSTGVIITNNWHYLVIETVEVFAHPIHMHGHDFYVLAKGSGSFLSANPLSKLNNPPRRDTEMLPALGYVLIAFQSDNPGAWLLHCHIAWHQSTGFSMQILDQMASIPALYNKAAVQSTCSAWNSYATANNINQVAMNEDGI